jgi:hypothetical protein
MSRTTLTRSFVKALPLFIIAVLLATSAAGGRNVATSGPSLLATGGPDGFGYIYIDSNEPGGPTFNWEDISGTGTPLTPITPDYIEAAPLDDVAWNRTIGFSFNFYGANYTQVAVDSNGYLNFDSGGGDFDPGNCEPDCPIPDTDKPNTAIYGLWEDLNPGEGGEIYVETRGVAPNRRFIVQYHNVPFIGTSVPVTFQIILFEGSNDILM